ncbi:hypothetical protein KCU78_g2606, partial [Aureobasidium melanogenum]
MQLPVFDEVRDHLVSPDHPARDEGDLDYERCAALHNAILKYAWTASGRSLEDLPLITCWEADADEWELDLDRLHPSMVEFLKRAYSTELPETESLHNGTSTEYKFFYFLEGLVGPHGHKTPAYNYDDFEDYPGQYMTLYTPNDRLGSHPLGLVYDQETHECVINFANIWFEPTDRALPWQRLETVLSVYIDMIESEKVVCIRDDVEQSGDIKRVVVDGDIKWLDTRDRLDAMLADPVTGVKRNRGVMFGPWIVQPYTKAVLERCLQIWNSLIQAIEDRMPRPPDNDTIVEYGLANEQMLDLAGVTKEFTKQILLRARRPRFTFIAPGLRLPTSKEFTEQPFKGIMTIQNDPQTRQTMPTLILRGDDSCKASKHFPRPYEESVPTGLYLADCTAIGTTLDQLDLKLKEAQSDPLMKDLMCQYKYEQILDVTKTLVAKGVFEIDQGSTLSYLDACRAAKIAKGELTKSKDDLEQSPGSDKDNTSTFRSLQSTVSGASLSTTSEAQKVVATSDTTTKHFDSLLQEHLKASKSPSTTSVVSPSPDPVKVAAHVFPPALLETENAAGASKELPPAAPWEPIKIPNMHDIEPTTNRNAIPESWKMKFLASQEVLEIVDDVDLVHNGTLGFENPPQTRLPSLQELEYFPDQDAHLNVNGLRLLDYEPLEVPSSVQLQGLPSEIHTPLLVQDPSSVSDPDAHLNVDDLQLLDSEPSKTSAPVPVRNLSESVPSGKAEVFADEQPLKPSKVLFVSGVGRGVSAKHLFKEFADVSPVDINFDASKRVAVVEFADVEAATKALEAKHGVFLSGRALHCEFGSEGSLNDQVEIPTIASEQPTDDHKDDESSISEEIVVNEQFGTPNKFLYVAGIAKSVNIERLFEEFADVSPVNINFDTSKRVAFIEFTDIEAATEAIKAKHGTFLCSKKLKCMFSRSENSFTKSVGIRTGASKQPINDHGDENPSVPEPPKVEDTFSAPTTITTDTIAVSTGTPVGTVAQVPEEIMKQSIGEASIDITAGTVKYAPTQTIPDELMLSSKPDSLDQTTSLRKVTKRQRKVQKAKAAQPMTKEPAPSSETRLDKSVFETLSKSIKDQAGTTTVEPPGATSDDEPLYDGGVYNESASSSSIDQATFHDLEKDDLVYEDEPSSSDEVQSKAYQELSRQYGLKKGPLVDRVLPEIRQYATIPVPRTRAYYLPYSSQNRVLSGLQASLERVCFHYLQRKHPELLEETPTRWAIDSAHALELNRYIYLLGRLIASNPAVDLGPGGSQSLQALIKSIAALRHHAVHRFRVDIEALRFWAVDAVRLAELLDDSEAAKQFSSLVSSLEAQQNRMKAEKMKAEGDLLVTVRELAAKRAELLRVEREAMTAYEVAHKQLPTRTSELDKVIDANIPLGHGLGVEWKETSSVEGTSSAKPASGIFGRIKSWFGA